MCDKLIVFLLLTYSHGHEHTHQVKFSSDLQPSQLLEEKFLPKKGWPPEQQLNDTCKCICSVCVCVRVCVVWVWACVHACVCVFVSIVRLGGMERGCLCVYMHVSFNTHSLCFT